MNLKIRRPKKTYCLLLIAVLLSSTIIITPNITSAASKSATWTTKGDFLSNQVLGPDFILGTVDDGTAGTATSTDSIVISNSNSPADSVTLDNVWQNIGPPNAISTAAAQQESALIYNDSQDEFLAVWVVAGSADWNIYAQRLDSNGLATGPEISVSTGAKRKSFPDVSYNSVNNEYLVTWSDYRSDDPYVPGSRANIYAQRILADGTKAGSEIMLSGWISLQRYPKVSYDPDTNQYLVVWENRNNVDGIYSYDIYGRLVKADGTFGSVETNLTPNTNSTNQFKPAVGYSLVKKQHVLTWDETPAPNSIFAQAVSPTLSPIGSAKEVAPSTTPQSSPALIYKPVSDEFLLLWNEQSNWPTNSRTDVYGQKINADVDLLDQQLIVSDNPLYQNYPRGSYSPLLDQFLVIWSDNRNNVFEVYGQAVRGDGSLVGANFAIKQGGTGGIAYSDLSNKFLVSFSDYSVGGGNLFGQLVGYPYLPTGNITGLKINAGSGNKGKWSAISWNGITPANTAVKFRTRGADSKAGLASAGWSGYYTNSGSAISTPDSQWLEIEATLVSTDGLQTPTLNDLTVNYDVISTAQVQNPINMLSTSLSLSAKPKVIKKGKATTIKGQIKDSAGQPVVGKKVVLKQKVLKKIKKRVRGKIKIVKKWIWRKIATLTTNSKGIFAKKLKPKATTIFKAGFTGDTAYKSANSKTVKVTVKKAKKKKK